MRILPGIDLIARVPCANTKFRDAAGFCLLSNRCWAGKPCPKTVLAAERARAALAAAAGRAAGVA